MWHPGTNCLAASASHSGGGPRDYMVLLQALFLCASKAMWGLGNDLSVKVCKAHHKPPYCWDPKFWHKRTQSWAQFWETYGTEIANVAPQTNVSSVGAAVHIRCGDVLLEPIKGYSYACKGCLVNALKWLLPYAHVHFVVGGHFPNQISRNDAVQAKHRCAAVVNHYMAIFNEHHFDVTVRYSRESLEDWWFLYRAHKVMALVPSSFSFTAKAHNLSSLKILGGFDIPPVWQYCRNASKVPGFRLC